MPRSTDLRSDRGATLVEYSLLIALIAVVALGALSLLGDNSAAAFEDVSDSVEGEAGSSTNPGPSDPGPGPSDPGPGPSDPGPGPSDPGPGPSDPGPGPSDPGPGDDDDAEVGGEDIDNDDTNGDNDGGEPADPPTVSSSFPTSSASRHGNSHNWTATADLLISGSDGQPLVGSTAVEVRVIERGKNRFGWPVEKVSTRTIYLSDGIGSISESARDARANRRHDEITSITYQVVDVSSVSGGTGVAWDGSAPTITVLAP